MGVVPDDAAIGEEQEVLNEPRYRQAKAPVAAYLARLQAARTPSDFVELHRDLLIEFGAHQDASDDVLPAARTAVREELAKLAREDPKPVGAIRGLQERLEVIARQDRVSRALHHTYRQVADAVAWKALRYDRRLFTLAGEGARVGRLASGVGRDAEIAVLGELWEDEGVFAIHNDMTNCIRHGDLTAIRAAAAVPEVQFIEVKAGRGNAAPQLERLEQLTRTLQSGRRPAGGQQGAALRIDVVPGRYRTFLSVLGPLISKARRRGYSWARVSPCLLVGAVDLVPWGADPERLSSRSLDWRARHGWSVDDPDILGWTASLRRMRDRRESFSSFAPFALYPLAADDLADLLMGFVDLAFSINLRSLERMMRMYGLAVRAARPPEASGLFLEAARGRVGVRLPPHLREQMMVELMTPASLARALDHVLAINASVPGAARESSVVVFEDEVSTWGPPMRLSPQV